MEIERMSTDNLASPPPTCQDPDDLIPDYLPGGGISLLAGAANIGKTALLAGLIRDLLAGRPIFGRTPRQVPIGYINADRGWKRGAGMWLQRAGVVVPTYSMADDRTFSAKRLRRKWERVDLLISFIDSLKLHADSLIIVDPLALFFGGNLLDYDSCMVACHEIRQAIRDRGCTLLGTAHAPKLKVDKKDRYARSTDQVLGSSAQIGYTDAVLYLASPEEIGKPYYELTWHPHGATREVYRLERNETGLFIPYSGVDEANKRRVLSCLPEDRSPLTLTEIVEQAEQFPLSKSTVQRVLHELIDEGLVEKAGYGKYRKIPVV